jgi:hypothetical protein
VGKPVSGNVVKPVAGHQGTGGTEKSGDGKQVKEEQEALDQHVQHDPRPSGSLTTNHFFKEKLLWQD